MGFKQRAHKEELALICKAIKSLQARVAKLKKAGIDVDQITAALSQLSTDVDALIAKGAGSISPAQAQTIVDGLNALDAKIKTALAS